MVILPYTTEYKEQLKEIFTLNTPTFYSKAELNDFISFLEKNQSTYYVIKSLGKLAGAGGYVYTDYTGRLIWNMIDPSYKGQGLGKTLVAFCIEDLIRNFNPKKLEVWTSEHAQDFYAKFGFVQISKKPNFRGLGSDLYHMQRPV